MTRNISLNAAILLGLQTVALGQSVVLSIGSGSATPGGSVTVPITVASTGGAQTTGLQWTFSHSSDITGVTAVAGASTTNAGKSLSCSGSNCLVAGINNTVISDGTVASVTFQIAANPSTNPIFIQVASVVTTTAGGTSIPSSGGSGTISLPVAVTLSSLSCSSSTINAPGTTSCSVALNGTAAGSGFAVSLSSNNANLTVPSSITIASGQSSNTFTATGAQLSSNQTGVVTASAAGVNLTSTLSLVAPAQLSALACAPSTLGSNASSTCTVTLNKAATSAATISLASNNGLLTVPANVTVPTGLSSAAFLATSGSVLSSQSAVVSATLNGQSQQATFSLAAAAQISSLSCSPATVNAPGTSTCTATLIAAASSAVSVALLSNNANVTVPASVSIGAGLGSATFTASVAAVTSDQTALLTSSLNGASQTFTLNAAAPAQLTSIACAPSTLSSNVSSTCTVTLNKAANSAATISLASNNGLLTVPASVTVATGQSSAPFTAAAGTVISSQNAIVSATLNGQSQQSTVSLAATAQLSTLTCSPSTVNAPGTSTCTASLTAAASSAVSVSLQSNNANETIPASVNIGVGLSSTTFTATIAAITSNQSALLTATLNGVSQSFALSATAPAQLTSLACASSTLGSNASSTCTVTLNKPPSSAATVSLASNNGLLTVPANVTVATGLSSATFTATSGVVSSAQNAIVTAILDGQSQPATISLAAAAAQLSSLSCSAATVNSPGTSACTVSLTAAVSSASSVTLLSNNVNVTVPASVNIGAGIASATFTATVGAVTSDQGALLSATLNGVSQSFSLSAKAPAQLSALSCAPSTLGSNASSTCTVTLTAAATGAAAVALASNNGLLTVPANVTVTAGQSTATFTAAAGTMSTSQNAIVTATLNGQSQQATISLTAAAQLNTLSCLPSTVIAPGTSTCTATMTAPASNTMSVPLLSNNINVTVPNSVTVIAGQTSASFTATAAQVSAAQSATMSAGWGNSMKSAVLSLAQPKSASSANANPLDNSTQGNWKGVYGADGYIIANDSNNPPAYLNVPATGLFTGASTYTWVASSPEPRSLLKAASAIDRIASTFYAGASYAIDLPFTDGLLHQVALYLLDLDTFERAETITILDPVSNAVLSTQSFANFHAGTWAIWNIQGPVRIQVTRTAGMNAVVSGLFFKTLSAGVNPSAAPPTVSINTPFANQQISGTQVFSATAAAANLPGNSIISVQFQLDGNNLGPAVTSGPPYTFSWTSATSSNGPHSLVAVATDNFSQSASSAAVAITVNNQLSTSAVFVKNDVTTQGSWKGHYGADGQMIARDSVRLPAYAAVNLLGGQSFQWTLTGDQRALQMANSASLHVASTYYDSPGFSLDLNLADGNAHQVSLYFMDWDGGGRTETVTILDAATQALLDTPRQVSNFAGGQYLVWNVKGHVTIQFTRISGANALLNGVFLAPVAP